MPIIPANLSLFSNRFIVSISLRKSIPVRSTMLGTLRLNSKFLTYLLVKDNTLTSLLTSNNNDHNSSASFIIIAKAIFSLCSFN